MDSFDYFTPKQDASSMQQSTSSICQLSDIRENESDTQWNKSNTQENKPEIRENKSNTRENKPEIRENKSSIREKSSYVQENKSNIRENKSYKKECQFDILSQVPLHLLVITTDVTHVGCIFFMTLRTIDDSCLVYLNSFNKTLIWQKFEYINRKTPIAFKVRQINAFNQKIYLLSQLDLNIISSIDFTDILTA